MIGEYLARNTRQKTTLQVVCAAIVFGLGCRLMAYDFPESAETYGYLSVISIYVSLIGIAVIAAGNWLLGITLAVVAATLFRSLSRIKSNYLASSLEASDFKNINWADLWTTLAQYPGILSRAFALTAIAAVLCCLAMTVWRERKNVHRALAFFVAAVAMTFLHHQLDSPSEARMIGSPGSLIGFAQSFYTRPADIRSAAVDRAQPEFSCPSDPKNILLVLQESTFYPKALGSELSGVLDEFFNQGEMAGPLRVHVYGGFTHLSDFAIQTGVPHSILEGDRMYAPKSLTGRLDHTLAKILKRCGYETTVIHPISRAYFNAHNWYKSVGFDHVISSEDLDHDPNRYWMIPDRTFFDVALESARRTTKPQFIYVATIAQHGPHDRTGDATAEYLTRLQQSAQAYMQLLGELEASAGKRPWIAGWFGDHRPHVVEAQDIENRYLTWFNIRSIPASTEPPVAYQPALDISFLSSVILQKAGIQNTMSQALLDSMLRTCSEAYFECPEESIRAHQDLLRISGAFAPVPP